MRDVFGAWARRLPMLRRVAAVAGLCMAALPARAGYLTIDFEDLSGDGEMPSAPLSSRGFVLDPGPPDLSADPSGWIGNHWSIAEPGSAIWGSNNGTRFIVVDYFPSSTTRLNIFAGDGSPFDAVSVDLGEGLAASFGPAGCPGPGQPDPYRVAFTGTRLDGSTISSVVTLDMVCDGAGPLADFEHFALAGDWTGLRSFSIEQLTFSDTPYSFLAIDNITLHRVPLPGTLALLATALLALALRASARSGGAPLAFVVPAAPAWRRVRSGA